jgi:hypothetical protein
MVCRSIHSGVATRHLHQGIVPALPQAAGVLMRFHLNQLHLPLVKMRHELPQVLSPEPIPPALKGGAASDDTLPSTNEGCGIRNHI